MEFIMTLQEYLKKKKEIMEMEESKYETKDEMIKKLNDLYYGQFQSQNGSLKQNKKIG